VTKIAIETAIKLLVALNEIGLLSSPKLSSALTAYKADSKFRNISSTINPLENPMLRISVEALVQ